MLHRSSFESSERLFFQSAVDIIDTDILLFMYHLL
jgi:hypothetical protein